MQQPMVFVLNVDADEALNDSFGKMLYHIHIHEYVMCSHHLDGDDYVVIVHVWQQILCHTMHRNVFSVFVVELTNIMKNVFLKYEFLDLRNTIELKMFFSFTCNNNTLLSVIMMLNNLMMLLLLVMLLMLLL